MNTFDLHNAHFLEYCEAECIAGRVGRELRHFKPNITKDEFIIRYRLSAEQFKFTDDEMQTHWEIHCRALKLLQDAWDHFNAKVRYNF